MCLMLSEATESNTDYHTFVAKAVTNDITIVGEL